jgi:hypothetical protein
MSQPHLEAEVDIPDLDTGILHEPRLLQKPDTSVLRCCEQVRKVVSGEQGLERQVGPHQPHALRDLLRNRDRWS